MTLVDTSIWIDHFRRGNDPLVQLLNEGSVLHHPLVYAELACGNLQNRSEVLGLLSALPHARTTDYDETLRFMESRYLFGEGLGWIDVNLLASAQLTRCRLWTFDKALLRAAVALGFGI